MSLWLGLRDRAELIGVTVLAGFLFVSSALPLVISLAVSPEAIERGEIQLTPPCPVRAETGRDCITCGMTRGFCAMSRLRLGDAQRYNGAAPWLWLATVVALTASGAVLVGVTREARARSESLGRPTIV